ncbi:ABC transporter permease [Companilactobacillus keshanensis]|uniref:ABC transporter permease n=1 Tax=Companilactobacillus keshanensis TaxID=2486003 RepID=A0ABW4BTN2_9LACO|nr:ABC transporter permease [Companilactobacillus keshanensis]
MTDLWKERLRRHQLNQFKYLRLIFNDNFVLAFIVLIGALGFWYSNFLDTINQVTIFGKPVVIILFWFIAQSGSVATLLEEPDSTFLLVKEKDFYDYFKAARNYSSMLPVVAVALVGFLMSPFAFKAAGLSVLSIIMLTLGVVVYKFAMLNFEVFGIYGKKNLKGLSIKSWVNLALIVLLILSAYLNSFILIVVAAILLGYVVSRSQSICESGQLQWQSAIDKENQRMFRIKRFYNLFTDVPGVNSKIRRRKWLDFLFKGIKEEQGNTYLYLFARGFVRNNEYIGLFMRLTIIQAIMLCLIDNFYISLIVEMLFIYLVGFQLKPYFKETMQNLMQRIYPVKQSDKIKDFTKLSMFVLFIQWLVSVFAILYKFGFSLNGLMIVAAGLAVLIFVGYFYIPKQLKKIF